MENEPKQASVKSAIKRKRIALVDLVKYTFRFAGEKRKWIWVYIVMLLAAEVVLQLDVFLAGHIFNVLQKDGINGSNIGMILILIFAILFVVIIFWVIHGPARIIEEKVGMTAANNFRDYLYKNLLQMPLGYHNEQHSGQLISKITKGQNALYSFSSNSFLLIRSFLRGISVFIILAYYDYRFAIFAIVFLVITYKVVQKFEKHQNLYRDKMNASDNVLSEVVYDTISNITTIKMLSLSKVVESSLAKETLKKYKAFVKHNLIMECKWFTPEFLGSIFVVSVLMFYVYGAYSSGSAILLGSLFIIYSYLFRLNSVLSDFAYQINNLETQHRDIINSEAISDAFDRVETDTHKQVKNIESIKLENLDFSYNEKYNLKIDKLEFVKGKKYAFVGESGCGKTTTLKILASLIKVNNKISSYNFKINNENYDIENMRDQAMLIPQEPELFSTTVRENLTLGIPFTHEEVNEVLEIVKMRQVVENLPEGIESKIFEKGVNLSGGQKQRLALARGLLFAKEKEILLLDEPTSSVDQENEEAIYMEIFEKYGDKIIISSVHKKNLLKFFDTIMYFENGKIARVEEN